MICWSIHYVTLFIYSIYNFCCRNDFYFNQPTLVKIDIVTTTKLCLFLIIMQHILYNTFLYLFIDLVAKRKTNAETAYKTNMSFLHDVLRQVIYISKITKMATISNLTCLRILFDKSILSLLIHSHQSFIWHI